MLLFLLYFLLSPFSCFSFEPLLLTVLCRLSRFFMVMAARRREFTLGDAGAYFPV
jgi:hypothetical protein